MIKLKRENSENYFDDLVEPGGPEVASFDAQLQTTFDAGTGDGQKVSGGPKANFFLNASKWAYSTFQSKARRQDADKYYTGRQIMEMGGIVSLAIKHGRIFFPKRGDSSYLVSLPKVFVNEDGCPTKFPDYDAKKRLKELMDRQHSTMLANLVEINDISTPLDLQYQFSGVYSECFKALKNLRSDAENSLLKSVTKRNPVTIFPTLQVSASNAYILLDKNFADHWNSKLLEALQKTYTNRDQSQIDFEDQAIAEYNAKTLRLGDASPNRSQLTSVRWFFLTGNPDGVLKCTKDGSRMPIEIKATKAKTIASKVSTQLQVYMALYGAKQGLLICKLPGREIKVNPLDYDETVISKILENYVRYLLPSLVQKKVARLSKRDADNLIEHFFAK